MGGKTSKTYEGKQKTVIKLKKDEINFSKIAARVDYVNISGLSRTKDDYISRAGDNLFSVNTFENMLLECNKTYQYLLDLGIFKNINIYIDVSKGKEATPNGYDITFYGTELPRIIGAIGTEVGQDEGFLMSELSGPNLLGRGERLTLQGRYSNIKTGDINLKYLKPFYHTALGDYRPHASFSLFRHRTTVPITGYKTRNFGFIAEMGFLSKFPVNLNHSLQYEVAFREIFTANKNSPFFVREQCGPRMASLVRHIVSYDKRDSAIFPSKGIYVKLLSEFCGLGGNIFYKSILSHSEFNLALFGGLVSQLCFRFGCIKESENNPGLPITSLYSLGGPSSLRGFAHGGIGQNIDGYPIGVKSFYTLGLHLWSPMPYSSVFGRLSKNLRTHLFYNLGNCYPFNPASVRTSAGLGIAYRLGDRARIELNYCWPIHFQSTDHLKRGFQFGLGYEFI